MPSKAYITVNRFDGIVIMMVVETEGISADAQFDLEPGDTWEGWTFDELREQPLGEVEPRA